MSVTAIRSLEDLVAGTHRGPSRLPRRVHLCVSCKERRSLFRYRGAVRADRDHTLCFRCYRALRDSMRAQQLAHAA